MHSLDCDEERAKGLIEQAAKGDAVALTTIRLAKAANPGPAPLPRAQAANGNTITPAPAPQIQQDDEEETELYDSRLRRHAWTNDDDAKARLSIPLPGPLQGLKNDAPNPQLPPMDRAGMPIIHESASSNGSINDSSQLAQMNGLGAGASEALSRTENWNTMLDDEGTAMMGNGSSGYGTSGQHDGASFPFLLPLLLFLLPLPSFLLFPLCLH